MKENSLARVLDSLPYMMAYGDVSWVGHYVTGIEVGDSVQVLEGPGPEFFDGPKPAGNCPWQPLKDGMHETLGPKYSSLIPGKDGTLIRRPADESWRPYGVYILSSVNGDFAYPVRRSPIWYIGTCSDGGWTRNRAFDHFFGPHAAYKKTVFETRKAKPHYGVISRLDSRVLIIEGLGSSEEAGSLESNLLASFRGGFGENPICNTQK